MHKSVSIPAGFSDALRRDCSEIKLDGVTGFQSLLGFLMRCDPGALSSGIGSS